MGHSRLVAGLAAVAALLPGATPHSAARRHGAAQPKGAWMEYVVQLTASGTVGGSWDDPNVVGGRRFTDAQVKFIQVSNTTAIERRDPQHYWNTVGVGTISINGSVLGWANGLGGRRQPEPLRLGRRPALDKRRLREHRDHQSRVGNLQALDAAAAGKGCLHVDLPEQLLRKPRCPCAHSRLRQGLYVLANALAEAGAIGDLREDSGDRAQVTPRAGGPHREARFHVGPQPGGRSSWRGAAYTPNRPSLRSTPALESKTPAQLVTSWTRFQPLVPGQPPPKLRP